MGSYNIPDELVVRISKLGEEPRVFVLKAVRIAVESAERNLIIKVVKDK
jgi:hypothetical protein